MVDNRTLLNDFTKKILIFAKSNCRRWLLTDILKKAHFVYSDLVNLDTSLSAQAYVISEFGKRPSPGCAFV